MRPNMIADLCMPAIGLAEAAAALRLPYQTAHREVLVGRLDGRKEGGRWMVTVASINEYRSALCGSANATSRKQ